MLFIVVVFMLNMVDVYTQGGVKVMLPREGVRRIPGRRQRQLEFDEVDDLFVGHFLSNSNAPVGYRVS
jgi:hypothetical protein